MTRNEFYLACLLIFLILAGVAYRGRVGGGGAFEPVLVTGETQESLSGSAPAEIPSVTAFVNINKAAPEELAVIPGVDQRCAENIVAFRQRYGQFSDLRELMEVPGIDRSRYEKIRPYVRLADIEVLSGPTPMPVTELPGAARPRSFSPLIRDRGKNAVRLPEGPRPGGVSPRTGSARTMEPLDLNRATRADLKAVEGIGDVLADRILQARAQRGEFRSWEEVEAIEDIGKTRLEALQRHFVIPKR